MHPPDAAPFPHAEKRPWFDHRFQMGRPVSAIGSRRPVELINRIVDGVGIPLGRGARRQDRGIIDHLGLGSFPHASLGA